MIRVLSLVLWEVYVCIDCFKVANYRKLEKDSEYKERKRYVMELTQISYLVWNLEKIPCMVENVGRAFMLTTKSKYFYRYL